MDQEEPSVAFATPKRTPRVTSSRRCSSCLGPVHEIDSDFQTFKSPNGVQTAAEYSAADKHCHELKKGPDIDRVARKKLIIASVLSLLFMMGEIAGGVLAHSLAIVSDAAHLLTDFASFMISLLAIYLASRRATTKLSFGWYRAEILGAFLSILFLWVVTGILVYMAVERCINKNYEIDAMVMLITASCGVAFNFIMGCTLHSHGHSHGHTSSHGNSDEEKASLSHNDSIQESQKSYGSLENSDSHSSGESGHAHRQNINVKAAFIHVAGDFIQSIGVLVAAIIIYCRPEWKLADPICTFLFSVFVVITTFTIMRDILVVLMEGTPRGLKFNDIKQSFFELKEVKDIHDLRIWSLSMDKIALSVHLAVHRSSDALVVLQKASVMVQQRYGITETTIQVEEFVDDMLDCTHCQDLPD